MMKVRRVSLIVLVVAAAVVLTMSGCSLSTSTATISVDNYYSADYTVEVESAGDKYLASYGTVSFDVEWDGLGEEDFDVDVWDGGVGGTLIAYDTVTLEDGDSVTLYW